MVRGVGGRPSEPDITHDGTGLVLLLLSALVAAGFFGSTCPAGLAMGCEWESRRSSGRCPMLFRSSV
ncbi:cell division protein FtsK [Cutibacterium acnes JCM 18909]|nr:cell division protein FtsK [Cutibacterium acnes JCM 18909]